MGLENRFCSILIREIQNYTERQSNNLMHDEGITMSQARTLAELLEYPHKQASLKELEKKLELAQSVTAGIVKRLEQKGYVESFGDPDDKRIKIVRITSLGEERCRIAQTLLFHLEKQLFSGLTDDEYQSLFHLLKKAKEAMDRTP